VSLERVSDFFNSPIHYFTSVLELRGPEGPGPLSSGLGLRSCEKRGSMGPVWAPSVLFFGGLNSSEKSKVRANVLLTIGKVCTRLPLALGTFFTLQPRYCRTSVVHRRAGN